MKVLCLVALLCAGAYAAPTWDCKNDDISLCFGLKAVAYMQRMARMDKIEIFDGLTIVGSGEVDRSGRALSEAELENSLPEDVSQKTSRLFDMFIDAAVRFLKTHTLQFKLPENAPAQIQRAFDEGRGKIKKTLLPLIIGGAAKAVLSVILIIGTLLPISLKALVIAKIALAIVAVIGLQKILGGGGGLGGLGGLGGKLSGNAGSGWNSGNSYSNTGGWSSSGGPYHRSFDEKSAQELAYGSQQS